MNTETSTNEQTIAGNTNNTELVSIREIEGTPFTIIKEKEKHFVAIGKYRLTEAMSEEEAEKDCQRMDWERLMQVMTIIAENTKEIIKKLEE